MAVAGAGIFFDGAHQRAAHRAGRTHRRRRRRARRAGARHARALALRPTRSSGGAGRACCASAALWASTLARLEVRDPALIAAIDDASVPVDRSGASERRGRMKVVVWSLIAIGVTPARRGFGVPALAEQDRAIRAAARRALARRGGRRAGAQDARQGQTGGPFECGGGNGEADGRAALAKLMSRLEGAAALADSARRQGRPARRGERRRAARWAHLRVRGSDR